MGLGNPFNNRQAQAGTTGTSAARMVSPIKALKDQRQIIEVNPAASITHTDAGIPVKMLQAERHTAARWCVLQGIDAQIQQRLLDAITITRNSHLILMP